jgi:small subunit ribosomal protein S2
VEKGNKLFAGVKDVRGLPGAVFVQDVVKDSLAIKEAHDLKIPVIALSDTNANPELVDYAIPANDDAVSSIKYIYTLVGATIEEAKAKRTIATPELKDNTKK